MSDDDSGSTIELNRRRILAGLGTIGVASAGAGAGTMALFSDTEESTGNAVQAGTLDLTLDDGSSTVFKTTDAEDGNIKPGSTGSDTVKVHNNGSLPGSVDINLDSPTVNKVSEGTVGDVRTFDVVKGTDQNGKGPIDLTDDMSLSNAKLEIDMSDDPYEFTITAPKDYADFGTSSGNDNVALSFDTTNSGEPDYHVFWNQNGWSHKDYSSSSGWQSAESGAPNDNVTLSSPSGDTVTIEVAQSELGDPFAIGGTVRIPNRNPSKEVDSKYGSNLVADLTPNFEYANGSDSYVRISTSEVRDLGDMLDVEVELTNGSSTQSVARGKVNRITGRNYDNNWAIPAETTHDLKVSYELSYNVGNAVQGEDVSFGITAELNQEDSQ